jgi:hypothetical protein
MAKPKTQSSGISDDRAIIQMTLFDHRTDPRWNGLSEKTKTELMSLLADLLRGRRDRRASRTNGDEDRHE